MIATRNVHTSNRVRKIVVYDAVIRRVQTRCNRVMVREGNSRESRYEAGLGLGAFSDEAVDVRRVGLVLVPEPEPVGRDENDHISVLLLLNQR